MHPHFFVVLLAALTNPESGKASLRVLFTPYASLEVGCTS